MKPIDLFDAMDGISETYIQETEQALERCEKKLRADNPVQPSAHESSRRSISNNSEITESSSRSANGTGTRSKQPVWQRIATGIAAAAAFAVFAGGGWFIAQQAKQTPPDFTSQLTDAGECNFLGGSGTVRIAGNMNLLYDDEKVYPRFAGFEAARSGSQLDYLQNRPILNDVLWDGETFYRIEGDSLYRIDNAGKDLDDTPFYTIDRDAHKDFFQGCQIDDAQILEIQKLAVDFYYIGFRIETPDEENNKNFGYLYNTASDKQELLLCDPANTPEITAYDSNHAYMSCLNGDIISLTFAPFNAELISDDIHLKTQGTNWLAANGNLYFMVNDTTAGNVEGRYDYVPDSYGKIDLRTGAYTEIVHEPDFYDFIPYGGKIYALSDDEKLICADPEWTEVETVFDFVSDLPHEIEKVLPQSVQDQYTVPILHAVDENYIQLSCPYTGSAGYLLIDRQTRDVRFLREDQPELQEETLPAEPEESNNIVNLFGGRGAIRPVYSSDYGRVEMYRDQDTYYLYSGRWCSCPVTGGQLTELPEQINGVSLPDDGFISDGEHIFTHTLDVISEGSGAPVPDTAELQKKMQELNKEAEPKGWKYQCSGIWHIRDSYFLTLRLIYAVEYPFGEQNPDLPNLYEIWTDSSGKILSEEAAPDNSGEGISYYFCSDDKSKMYAIINQELYQKEYTDGTMKTEPVPNDYGKLRDICFGEDADYYTKGTDWWLYTRENGQEIRLNSREFRLDEHPMLAPDQRFFYCKTEDNYEDTNDQEEMRSWDSLWEWKGSGEKKLIYQPETDSMLRIIGYESDEKGGYYIIVNQMSDQDPTVRYLFIDPVSGQIRKQIQI